MKTQGWFWSCASGFEDESVYLLSPSTLGAGFFTFGLGGSLILCKSNHNTKLEMKLFIKVKTRAKENSVKKIDNTHFVVFIKESPVQGKANAGILRTLADYLDIAPSRLNIVSGYTSRQKIIEVK